MHKIIVIWQRSKGIKTMFNGKYGSVYSQVSLMEMVILFISHISCVGNRELEESILLSEPNCGITLEQ